MSEADVVTKPVEATEPQVDNESKATEAGNENAMLKTTAQIDHKNYKNNRKFDPSSREVTDDPETIRKQVRKEEEEEEEEMAMPQKKSS